MPAEDCFPIGTLSEQSGVNIGSPLHERVGLRPARPGQQRWIPAYQLRDAERLCFVRRARSRLLDEVVACSISLIRNRARAAACTTSRRNIWRKSG